MYQKVIIAGRLGSDPEMRYTPEGVPVASFSVASNRKWTNANGLKGSETTWFRVSAWRALAETCSQYLIKGREVLVEGRLRVDPATGGPRVWTGNDGQARASFEVEAATVQFLGGKGAGGAEVEDDIPF